MAATLHFQDIDGTMNLALLAENDKKHVEISLTRLEITEEEQKDLYRACPFPFIPLDVVVAEWKEKLAIISFQATKATLSLLVTDHGDVFKFEEVFVKRLKLKTRYVHILILKNPEGQKFNRRNGVRLDINKEMDAYQAGIPHKVYVNDVSWCGIGLLQSPGDSPFEMDLPITITLIDPHTDTLIGHIQANPARRVEMDEGKLLTGCTVDKQYHNILQKYIAIKQVEGFREINSRGGIIQYDSHHDWKQSAIFRLQNEEMMEKLRKSKIGHDESKKKH